MGKCDSDFGGGGDGDFGPPEGEETRTAPGFDDDLAKVNPDNDKEFGDDRRAPTRDLPEDIRLPLMHRIRDRTGG
jgi:hypothetical protein